MSINDLDSTTTLPSHTEPVVSVPQHEWDATGAVPEKPAHWEYGYVINGQTYSSTREQLPKVVVERGAAIKFVWTAETPEPVFPERLPFLLDAFRRIQVKNARNTILVGAGLLAFGVFTAVVAVDGIDLLRNIFFVLGAFGLTEGIWRYSLTRNYTQENAISDASSARFAAWLENKNLSGYTFTLCACIVLVVIVQAFAGPEKSIELAGLVKPAVWDGQTWRLFTATLMHGSFMHFFMNFYALIHLSKIIDQTLERALVPLVFLVTGAIGSIFSLLLYPNAASIGASGGLMGLFGFIAITAYLDRTKYPPKYFRLMIEGIILVGVFGLFGFAFIDNAAHLGGLLGGLLLGWLFFKRNAQENKTSGLLKFGGAAALCLLVLVAATAVYRMST